MIGIDTDAAQRLTNMQ